MQQTENIYQFQIEDAVIKYQLAVKNGDKHLIEDAYRKITSFYDPLDFWNNWYEQYKYLFDSQEDFIADYLKVFVTVLLGWKPRNKRGKSRYNGSGEFKNYFIGSLNHNYINLIKADQAAKRNTTKKCPLCDEWVNPLSTHLINNHQELLWTYLKEIDLNISDLKSCPFCKNFKIAKSTTDSKITSLIKAHFLSKHSSLLFNKFNEMYPEISTISPKVGSTYIEEGNEELDIYEITEDNNCLINQLYHIGLTDVQKNIVEHILNGDSNVVYKNDKYKCSKDEFEQALDGLKDILTIYGTH